MMIIGGSFYIRYRQPGAAAKETVERIVQLLIVLCIIFIYMIAIKISTRLIDYY